MMPSMGELFAICHAIERTVSPSLASLLRDSYGVTASYVIWSFEYKNAYCAVYNLTQ
jgi:hypothetical protein